MNKISPITQYGRQNPPQIVKDTFYYFYHLDERDLSDFPKYWDNLQYIYLDSKGLAIILHKTAKHLTSSEFPTNDVERAYEILSQELHIWGNKAINHMVDFNPQDLSNSLWALAAIGISPPNGFMMEWMGKASDILHKFDIQNLCNSYWALSVLDSIEPNETYKEMAKKIREKIKLNKNSDHQDIKQAYDVDLWFEGTTDLDNVIRAERKSFEEFNLKKAFNIAGYSTRSSEHDTIPGLPKAGDFIVENPLTKEFFIIEDDGKHHFLGHTSTILNGHTLFRGALMNKLRPDAHILRMGMRTGGYIRDSSLSDQNKICRAIFNETVKKPPGVYRTAQRRDHRIVPLIPIPMTESEYSPAQKSFG